MAKTVTLNVQQTRSQQEQHQPDNLRRQWAQFLLLIVSLSLLWLVILPRAAEIPRLRSGIDFLEQKKIDPTAMFYSDLETIEDTMQNINLFHQENPNALW